MKKYEIESVKNILLFICQICASEKDNLTEIDSHLGDGDMGLSMEKGAVALEKELGMWGEERKDLTELFFQCASVLNHAAPSTLGTLLSFGLMHIGRELSHANSIPEEQIPKLIEVFSQAIRSRGRAEEGQKTILDSLLPFSRVLDQELQEGCSFADALKRGADAAWEGMERTKGMEAKTGRASWLGSRNQDWPDGGAYLCAVIVKKIAEIVNQHC